MTVDGNFDLQGNYSDRSIWDGMDLNVSGTTLARWAYVRDSDASSGETIEAYSCTNGGNNLNWWFWDSIDDEELDEISEAVWKRLVANITQAGSFGTLVQKIVRSETPENELAVDSSGRASIPMSIVVDALLDVAPGITGTITDATPSATSFATDLTSTEDGHYNLSYILITDGPLKGQARLIAREGGYAAGVITLEAPFTSIPADGTPFIILGRSG